MTVRMVTGLLPNGIMDVYKYLMREKQVPGMLFKLLVLSKKTFSAASDIINRL